ncbi:hypothetical protein RDV78_05985 [Bacillota bacterium LX-D]|nr:hypothetical protein [Bacillota bacterium LX-D]
MTKNHPPVYIYGSTLQAESMRASLKQREVPILEIDANSDEFAHCKQAFLFVQNLSEAEEALRPVRDRRMKKIMLVTDRDLYSVSRSWTSIW